MDEFWKQQFLVSRRVFRIKSNIYNIALLRKKSTALFLQKSFVIDVRPVSTRFLNKPMF